MSSLSLATLIIAVTIFCAFSASSSSLFVSATYINSIGYNMMRPALTVPQQPHQVQFPPEDTRLIAAKAVKEAAVVCDPIAPVMRAVLCEVHTFDECGNPFGSESNTTRGWDVFVEELDNYGSTNRLVSPIIWLEQGIGRFYFTPVRIGLHRVVLQRISAPWGTDLRVKKHVGAAGFLVRVHDMTAKGLSAGINEAVPAVARLLWAQASHNSEAAKVPPGMVPTETFEDKEHRFDNRVYGMLQQNARRAPLQPERVPPMPARPARDDDNTHRLVDLARP